jgi:hypothetical protein
MATKERLEQALRNADKAGDVAAARRFAAAIRAGEFDQVQPMNTDVPGPEQDAYVAQVYAQSQPSQQAQKIGMMDRLKAIPEVAATMATGATTGLLGNIAGTLQQGGREIMGGQFGTQEAADRIEQRAADVGGSATYSPKSPAAQEMLRKLGEVSAPFAGAAGLTAQMNIAGNAARSGVPALRTSAAQGIKSAGEAAKQELGILSPSNYPKQLETIKKIKEGSTENELAQYRIEPKRTPVHGMELRATDYKLVPDDTAKKAMDQEWEPGTVQSVKNFDPKTAEVAARMLRVAQMGTKDDTFKANNRPLAEMGDEFAKQVWQVKRAKKQAGEAINEAAKSLKNERVDVAPAVDRFLASVSDDLGVQITPAKNGVAINFRGSNLEGNTPELKSAQGVLKNLIDRMYNTKTPSAFDVHRLKMYIDTQASYGSTLGGLKGNTDRIVKGLRHDLDTILDENFDSYRAANQDYAQTKTALDAVQDLVGKKINLDADYSPQVLGRLSRRILSNAQSAERVRDALINIDDVAMQYGSESAGNLTNLVKFADTLDKQFGIAADTSFASEVGKGVTQGLRQSKIDTALDMAGSAYQKLKGVNTDNKYKTMNELLDRQRGAKKMGNQMIRAPK